MKYMLAVCLLLAVLSAKGSSQQPVDLDAGFLPEQSEMLQPSTQPHSHYESLEEAPRPVSMRDPGIEHSALGCECGPTHRCRSRAGNPHKVAFWARPAKEHKYKGYYVGGGVTPGRLSRGEDRFAHEGTWGKDYSPWYSRVQLLWSHGRLFQGGTGSYEPDHHNVPLGQRYGRRIRRGH